MSSTAVLQNAQYWLTPRPTFDALNAEFAFDFDPCPCPLPEGFDSLSIPWGRSNFVNPPFRRHDGVNGKGPTAFVRKAIEEQANGKTSVLILPVQSYVNLLLEAGAELRSLGRLRWVEATTREPCKSPSPICCFVLRGKAPSGHNGLSADSATGASSENSTASDGDGTAEQSTLPGKQKKDF